MELAPTAREEGFMERFYLYLMMTKPSDQLILSYPTVTAEGKQTRPSGIIGEMKTVPGPLYPGDGSGKRPDVSVTAAGRAILSWLQAPDRLMDPENEKARELYSFLSSDEAKAKEMEDLAKAVAYSYKKGGIGRAAARALRNTLRGSVTRMEGYAGCAYSHFLNHGLGLGREESMSWTSPTWGNLFHQSLDTFFRNVRDHGKDFRPSRTRSGELVKRAVEEVSAKYRNTIMKSSEKRLPGKKRWSGSRTGRCVR